jgi:aryl-phospho-beta-D-glucosidase BglC (GH1 family)
VKLKKLLWLFVAVLLCTSSVTACGDSNDEPSPVGTEFKVTTTDIKALKSGGQYSIIAQSTNKPSFSADASWVTISSVTQSGSKGQIWTALVNVDANTSNDDRNATITVSDGTNKATVAVSQIAADGLYLSESNIPETVPTDGGTYNITILSNNDCKISTSDSWISVAETSRAAMTEKKYVVTVSANRSDDRNGSISVTSGELSLNITINQLGQNSDMSKTAIDIAKDIYAGWNIGNTLEAYSGSTPSETAWGNPKITEKLIKSIKEAGFNAVRLPTAWDGYIEDRSTYKIQDAWLNRVDEIVKWCVENDMYAIVNIHWDGGWLEENCTEAKKEENLKEQKALWTQIANKLGGYDEHLLFAGANEPNVDNASQMAVLLEYEQAFIDAVRATGGRNYNRTLIVQGPATDIDKTNSLFLTMPTDVVKDRLMVEVHYYAPWNFCGLDKDESWGKMFYFWGEGNHISGSDRNATWGEEDYLLAEFAKMQQQFVNKGIPVILGEYGAIKDRSNNISNADELAAHKKSRYDFNMKVTREAKNHGMVPFMWDTGEGMSRSTGTVTSDVIIPAIMEGAAAGKYPF